MPQQEDRETVSIEIELDLYRVEGQNLSLGVRKLQEFLDELIT